MLKDVIDLRAAKWVSRRITDAPKTITEIHEEVKQEEIQMQLAHQQAAQKRMMNKGGNQNCAASWFLLDALLRRARLISV